MANIKINPIAARGKWCKKSSFEGKEFTTSERKILTRNFKKKFLIKRKKKSTTILPSSVDTKFTTQIRERRLHNVYFWRGGVEKGGLKTRENFKI